MFVYELEMDFGRHMFSLGSYTEAGFATFGDNLSVLGGAGPVPDCPDLSFVGDWERSEVVCPCSVNNGIFRNHFRKKYCLANVWWVIVGYKQVLPSGY